MAALAPAIESSRSSGQSPLNHIFCCDRDTALCGADVSNDPIVELEEADCVVCLDLEEQPCPYCGE